MIPKILVIAGSDPSSGAGIQADIKTAFANKTYAATAITCMTAQNTKAVFAIQNSSIDFLKQQIEVLFADISFDAIKIGMLGTTEIINCVGDLLKKNARKIPIILDSVMVATSGDILLEEKAVESFISRLAPLAYIITPNIFEAEILAKMKIKNLNDMKLAATKIKAFGAKNVLIKGGHLNFKNEKIISILLDEKNNFHEISNKKIKGENFHGTGCTLASAIACNIAKKMNIETATRKANQYVYRSIVKNLKIGKGSLVLGH